MYRDFYTITISRDWVMLQFCPLNSLPRLFFSYCFTLFFSTFTGTMRVIRMCAYCVLKVVEHIPSYIKGLQTCLSSRYRLVKQSGCFMLPDETMYISTDTPIPVVLTYD